MDAKTVTASLQAGRFAVALDHDATFEFDDLTEELWPAEPGEISESPDAVGARLCDRYLLQAVVGSGGTGTVYRCLDLQHQRHDFPGAVIAIKLSKQSLAHRAESNARLEREYRQTSALDHPNVLRMLDLHRDSPAWFITMELLEGETLQHLLQRNRAKPIGTEFALEIAAACISALAHAHDRGVIHGDIKPANIFIERSGLVRLIDFGSGGAAGVEKIAPTASRAYSSPEVLSGAVPEARDDTFSLSCVIYEMFAGVHPFGRCASRAAQHANLYALRPRRMSSERWSALQRGLAWERAGRPASMLEFLDSATPTQSTIGIPQTPALLPRATPTSRTTRPPHAQLPADRPAGPPASGKHARRPPPLLLALGIVALVGLAAWSGRRAVEPEYKRALTPSPPIANLATLTGFQGTNATVVNHKTVTTGTMPVAENEYGSGDAKKSSIGFDIAAVSVGEQTFAAALKVHRLDHSGGRALVRWTALSGSAIAGKDFKGPTRGVAVLAPGQTQTMIYIPIVNDAESGKTESFIVELHPTATARTPPSTNRLTVTIIANH